MKAYFLRRLLLVLPTLLGITLMVFSVTRFAPGGPMEKALQAAAAGSDGEKSGAGNRSSTFSEEELESMEEQYGQDKPLFIAYLQWLGLQPKEDLIVKKEFKNTSEVQMVLIGDDRLVSVEQRDGKLVAFHYVNGTKKEGDPRQDGWSVRIESPEDRKERKARRDQVDATEVKTNYSYRAVVYKKRFAGLLQGHLGHSLVYGDSVWSMILERVPIAFYFGVLSTLIIYGVCIPLGILKAIGHRSWYDNVSSIAIFVGYSIPGYAFGAILLVYLGANKGWFPLFGMTSDGFESLSFWAQVKDIVHHTVLPLLCYIVGGFAFLTMMMKNNLMDHLAADYVRTAMAKGVSFRRAVTHHAFRNAFIPIATGLGHLVALFIGGSMLIESVFDIQGFGMLQYQAVLNNDYPVVMGTLTIAAFFMLIGNILSDVIVSFVDPRIQFN